MRRTGAVATIAAVLCVPAAARAQDPDQPLLMVGMAGGVSLARDLWRVAPQLATVAGQPDAYDSLAVSRRLPAALLLGMNITYFRGVLGYTFESTWLGLRSESGCRLAGTQYNPSDPQRVNEQTCVSLQGSTQPTSAMTFQLGVAARAAPAGPVQPYARTSVGFAFIGGNFAETSGLVSVTGCAQCRRTLIEAPRRAVSFAATLGAGVMLRFQPAYQFRFEVRDQMLMIQEVEAPAHPVTLDAPVRSRLQHIPTMVLGMDVLLIRTHTRRY